HIARVAGGRSRATAEVVKLAGSAVDLIEHQGQILPAGGRCGVTQTRAIIEVVAAGAGRIVKDLKGSERALGEGLSELTHKTKGGAGARRGHGIETKTADLARQRAVNVQGQRSGVSRG